MKKVLFVVGLLMMIGLAACGGGQAETGSSPDTIPADYVGKTNPFGVEAVAVGAEIFKANCASCHGNTGHGDGPAGAALVPVPKNLAELQTQVGDDYLFWRINTGKEGTAMVSWQDILTEEQIWQVISFLRTLEK
jgi:mono/diheme cytochrome c family protein